jgi:hypothetical protein
VTTIPAAAYLGVAAGPGEGSQALGALAVLGTNVVLMVAGAAIALSFQRHNVAVIQSAIDGGPGPISELLVLLDPRGGNQCSSRTRWRSRPLMARNCVSLPGRHLSARVIRPDRARRGAPSCV